MTVERIIRFWAKYSATRCQVFLLYIPLLVVAASDTCLAQINLDDNPNFVPGGAEVCLACHGEGRLVPANDILHSHHGFSANPQSPFAVEGIHCQTCHGPSSNHLMVGSNGERPPPPIVFDQRTPATTQNGVCLSCHQDEVGQEWHGGIHQFEQLSCHDCHQIHISKDPILSANNQPAVCFTCHQQQRAELLRQSAHPVARGLLGCSDCHAPHGGNSAVAMLKKLNVNELCYDCHAEKRGPLLWEHAPVREECTNCHLPHGSNHNSLLVARPPFLCQQCHLAQFHPSTSFSGDDVPPNGASRLLLNRNCMNCHSQIHGSNHPSGSGLIR